MDEPNLLLAIAARCRQDHTASLVVIGFCLANTPAEDLQRLLSLLDETAPLRSGEAHLEAYRERWGRLPGRPS